jgi:D-amino peptidase
MLHADLNAVVEGILSTGEHEVWVYDMHYYGLNLDMDELDARVRVVCGKPDYRPGNLGGLTSDFDGQILLGLHARAGTGELLSHTYEHQIQELRLNNVCIGEIGLEAALAGELGVPTCLVTGDSAGCAEARALLGDLPTVTVKESIALHAGVCYPTSQTGEWLVEGGRAAVDAVATLRPYRVEPPITLTLTLADDPFSDHVKSRLAEWVLPDGTVQIRANSVAEAWVLYLQAKR